MSVRLLILTAFVLATLVVSPVQAQAPKCDPATLVKKANALKADSDNDKSMAALLDLSKEIQAMSVNCQKKQGERPLAMPPAGKRNTPVPVGMASSLSGGTEHVFRLAVIEVIRGKPAADALKKANMFNGAASAGKEFLLANIEIAYGEGSESKPLELTDFDFKVVSKNQIFSDISMIVPPEPRFPITIFPNTTVTAWLAKEVYADDPNPLLLVGSSYSGSGGVYFSTQVAK